jgi:hypothetical protein
MSLLAGRKQWRPAAVLAVLAITGLIVVTRQIINGGLARFANNPHAQSFRNITVTKDGFASTLSTYQKALVEKATAQALPSQSLKACLDSIEPTGWLAVLPVGAYLATYEGDEIWILVCRWEGMSPDRPTHLGHVRV